MTERAEIPWRVRLAVNSDVPALERLIPNSVHGLQAAHYSFEQRMAALGPVFGVDHQLIADRTYFAVEAENGVVGAGGWSKRLSLFGGGPVAAGPPEELDPKRDPARIRAFFVDPGWTRLGIGRAILEACEEAILVAEFRSAELVATLAGEPLYAACGYRPVQRYSIPLAGGLELPAVRMTKWLR